VPQVYKRRVCFCGGLGGDGTNIFESGLLRRHPVLKVKPLFNFEIFATSDNETGFIFPIDVHRRVIQTLFVDPI